jgi:MFS family permease
MHHFPKLAVASLSTSVFVAFGVSLYAMSVLITEEGAGSEFSVGTLSAAFGGAAVIAGLLAPLIGRHVDNHSVRGVAVLGSVLGAAAMVVFATSMTSVQVLAAFWLLLGPATAMTLYEPAFVAIGQWVHGDHRNRAIGMLVVIAGLAGPVFLPLTGFTLDLLGWRWTAVALGCLFLASAALAAFVYPNIAPADESGGEVPHVGWSRFRADPRLLLITVSIVLAFASMQTVLFHRVAIFEEHGYDVTVVALLAGLSGLLTFPGRYLMPRFAHHVPGTRFVTVACGGLITSLGLAVIGVPAVVMVLFFVSFGVFFGILLPTRPVIMNEWYGGPDFGAVMGKQWAVAAVAGGITPWLVGLGRDVFGSYAIPIIALAAVMAVALVFNVAAERMARREVAEPTG